MAATSTLRELWDTTRMRLLVEIERRGSVSAAAAAIGIGQPSASQHLRLLETAAGQQLVERSGRGSRLTQAGQVLAARAAQALSSLGAAEEELAARDRRGAAGDRRHAGRNLGARLERGDQARRPGGARPRVPIALCGRRGGRAQRPRILPSRRQATARPSFLRGTPRRAATFACGAAVRRDADELLREAGGIRRGVRRCGQAAAGSRSRLSSWPKRARATY